MKYLIRDIAVDFSSHYRLDVLTAIFLVIFRVGRYLFLLRSRFPFVWVFYIPVRFLHWFFCAFSGSSIPFACSLGQGVVFRHGIYGVFISASAVIGEKCVLMHQVTIGSRFDAGRPNDAPILGKDCFVGPGAKVIGKIRIGDGSKIGPNAVVINDVPANSIVVAPKSHTL